MGFGTIVNKAIGVGRKIGTFAVKHAPEISLGLGTVSVIAGGVLACKSTLKAEQLLDEHRGRMDIVHQSAEKFDEESYTKTDQTKDTIAVYAETTGKFARLYGPSILLSTAGFAAIFWGFGLLRKRYGLVLGAFAALDSKFSKYRGNVIAQYGEDVDHIFAGETPEILEAEYKVLTDGASDDEDAVYETSTVSTIDLDSIDSDLMGIFNWKSPRWDDTDFLFAENDILQYEQRKTLDLQSGRVDHIWLNDQRKAFGLEEVPSGHMYARTNSEPGTCLDLEVTPYYILFNDDDHDHQFPMTIPVHSTPQYDENGNKLRPVYDEDEWAIFREVYTNDPHNIGFLIKFDVDTDEHGVPVERYHEIYGLNKK